MVRHPPKYRTPIASTRLTPESSSTVISVFAIVILSIIGGLYRSGHEEFVGGTGDPEDGKAVAGTVFTAVIVYAVRCLEPPLDYSGTTRDDFDKR